MKNAWAWVKKHWELLVGGVLLVIGFLFGISVRKKPIIVPGKDPEQTDIEKETDKEEIHLQKKVLEEKKRLEEQHSSDLQEVISSEVKKQPSLESDADATNAYLKQVGDAIQGGSSDGGSK